ncbi:hypothetical protein TRIUR3_02658 [Triticum urartu]|uniref:Glycosyltransferase 2-like domain-containing protein n=1 Tax=Triticum urartu TaxID=4572 RepID=M7YFJ3_TRIUA|nr:hypothetical protein TRIUR3_02658 [Triticum urartu]
MLCMAMSLMVLAEKVLLAPPAIPPRDEEAAGGPGACCFPMVLVQIPMYNEREVLDDSTDAAIKVLRCSIHYHSTNFSTKLPLQVFKFALTRSWPCPCMQMQELVREECERWAGSGVDPSPDFLARTVPLLLRHPGLALVQARWEFDECLLTRMQEMSMDYHFKVEQQAGSSLCNFFGYNVFVHFKIFANYNWLLFLVSRKIFIGLKLRYAARRESIGKGSAGVWRRQAIVESGGWDDRTTAEDMDLALRAALLGWDFVYIGDIKVKSELPSSLRAYRSQQHRWSCGPALLFKKMLREVLAAERVPAWKKLYIVYNFFVTRRVVSTFFTFFFFSVLLPAKTLFPQVRIPAWQMVCVPTATTLLNSAGTPWRRSAHLVVPWVAFENAMALYRFKAILIGLFEAGRANEWIVTRKSGNSA